jgi:hypothetical protein
LLFLDLMHKFDTSECDGRIIEALKAEYQSHSLFDSAMVLFNQVL